MKGLIVLGGKPIVLDGFIKDGTTIICADGGADALINQGFMPDVLLGDMDSITKESFRKCKTQNVKVIEYPTQKDMTDGQLAVIYAKDNNICEIDIVCVEGSLDHYLGNLYLILFAKQNGVVARLHTKDMVAQVVDDKIILKGEPNKRVSIVPANGNIIVKETSGLYYEIENALPISFGDTIGLGNHMISNTAIIIMQKGTAFIITEKK